MTDKIKAWLLKASRYEVRKEAADYIDKLEERCGQMEVVMFAQSNQISKLEAEKPEALQAATAERRRAERAEQKGVTDMTAIRPIVKAAFKVSELWYQFGEIDTADGLLEGRTYDEILLEVNEKYDDAYLIKEAENRLDIAMDPYNQEEECWRKDAAQLRRFIKRWSK